jgi:gliding motility-associated protein GldC
MRHSVITINVRMDERNHPDLITWKATDSSVNEQQAAKAMMLAFWDPDKKTTLHIDLWTKQMMVDEMAEFYFQMLTTMADTFCRATAHTEFVAHMKNAASEFRDKFIELRSKEGIS